MSAPRPSDSPAPRGVYLLGNDRVAGYLEALFSSLRRHSPDLPVRLIPYNDQLTLTRALCARYRVTIHTDPSFPALEEIGLGLWGSSPYSSHQNLFRRLAIFWGAFETFLYLDADIVVLAPLEPLFAAFERNPAPFACFDVDHERVYQAGPLRERMIRDHGSIGFNSGHFFSRRGAFTLATFQAAFRHAQPQANLFQDRGDQGFLNYAVDYLGIPHARMPALVPGLADKQWCEQRLRHHDGAWRIDRPGDPEHGRHLVLLHWAGYNLPGWHLPNRAIYYDYLLADRPPHQRLTVPLRDFTAHALKPLRPALDRLRVALGRVRQKLRGRSAP